MSRRQVWILYLGLWVAATIVSARLSTIPDIRVAHGVLAYLLLIIGASRQGGRTLSAVMVVLGYLAVDYYYVPPRLVFGGTNNLDLLILIGFVLTGVVISALFGQLRGAVQLARERTLEVQRLSEERLQLEREASTARVLFEADRLKNALIGSIAHDLRSPVATLALLADPEAGFAPDAALQRVGEESRRLGDFLATLQRFATAGGGSALQLEPHTAQEVALTALRSAEALLRGRDVRIDEVHGELPVTCDLTLTVQVMGNLLQNAARYAPEAEPIEIRFERAELHVDLVVADRGPGLAGIDVERLFTPLRRPPEAWNTGDHSARMGMGLSIARTFARAQRGDVCYRARPGGGSEFVLRLLRPTT